ncbi:MAG: hypothetical protein AAFQ23_10345 [Cyanobacteria bacterium J06623_1]
MLTLLNVFSVTQWEGLLLSGKGIPAPEIGGAAFQASGAAKPLQNSEIFFENSEKVLVVERCRKMTSQLSAKGLVLLD